MVLRMAVPNKGRLNERAVELLVKSGLDLGEEWGRKLYVKVKNKDIETYHRVSPKYNGEPAWQGKSN